MVNHIFDLNIHHLNLKNILQYYLYHQILIFYLYFIFFILLFIDCLYLEIPNLKYFFLFLFLFTFIFIFIQIFYLKYLQFYYIVNFY